MLGLLTFAALVYWISTQYPRPREVSYRTTKFVPEEIPRIEKRTVEVNGQDVEVEVEVRDTHYKPVWEERTNTVIPSAWDYLRTCLKRSCETWE